MENKSHALAAGLFVLLMGAGLLAVVAWFQGDHSAQAHYIVVASNGVPGLNLKASVKYEGVEIGKVEDIHFDTANPRQVLVDIAVVEDAPLNSSTFAQLGYQGITGLTFIDLNDDPTQARGKRAEDSHIELRPSLLDRISGGGPQLLTNVAEAVHRVNLLLDDANLAHTASALANVDAAAGDLSRLAQSLQPAAAQLAPLARNGQQLLKHADGTLAHFDALADESTQLASELRRRAAVLDQMSAAATQLQRTTAKLEAALVGPDHQMDRPLIDELAQTAKALRHSAEQLSKEPQSLLLGRPVPAPGPGEPGFTPPGQH